MSNLIVLGFGSFLLGLLISYSLWIKVRASLLRAEMQSIRSELDQKMKSKGTLENENYIALRVFIHEVIENAEYISIPVLLLFFKMRRDSDNRPSPVHPSESSLIIRLADFIRSEISPEEVKEASTRVFLRLFLHLALTPSMIVLWVILSISGRTENLAYRISSFRNDPRDLESLASFLKWRPGV